MARQYREKAKRSWQWWPRYKRRYHERIKPKGVRNYIYAFGEKDHQSYIWYSMWIIPILCLVMLIFGFILMAMQFGLWAYLAFASMFVALFLVWFGVFNVPTPDDRYTSGAWFFTVVAMAMIFIGFVIGIDLVPGQKEQTYEQCQKNWDVIYRQGTEPNGSGHCMAPDGKIVQVPPRPSYYEDPPPAEEPIQ